MLVLGRKPGEYVVIDNKIKIKVVKDNEYNDLRLAISAPEDMEIVRGEIWEQEHEGKSIK
ncbi:carbon storage regulator [Clostridium sp. HV4-5-A1G]|uniref:carbon storage regulator n=1 Tax=Clostridium sp. HV4-5-A1G TaxID=2004595 RepID=UPI001238DEDE|nr:carbon storage regulator [Clostridium sp. HV4-5-A1G]KAA8674911.1 carbon storage regulator [Clostridium sp. HV4-5-A1G]